MRRRDFAKLMVAAGIGMNCFTVTEAAELPTGSDFFKVIRDRHSSRAYTEEEVSNADVEIMLRCAMQAPSAANEQPWEFVVIREKSLLEQVGGINHWASFAKNAPLAILVCLNTQKEKEKGMGIIDIGACSENLMLAATALGLGSVFTGIYPYPDRMDGFSKLCSLPDFIKPVGLIVIGHPKVTDHKFTDRYNPAAVHQNKW